MQDNVHPTRIQEDRTEPAQAAASRSRHWFMRLTEPSASLQNPKQRYQAQFVATLMVLALPVIVPLGIIVAFRQNNNPGVLNPHQTWIIGIAWVLEVAAYLLSRTRWYQLAAWIGIISTTAGTILMTLTFPHRSGVDFFLLSLLALPTLVASVMLSRWQTIGFTSLIAAITLIVPGTFATVEWSPRLLIPFAFYVSSSAIILIYGYYRDRLEEDRQTELRRKDFRLQAAYETLEQRIIERTNELSRINQQLQEQMNEREQAEAALIQERTLLRTIVDSIPDIIYARDPAGYYMLDNRAHLKQVRAASFQEVIGKKLEDFFPPDIAAKYEADDQHVLQTGQIIHLEEPSVHSETGTTWNVTTKVPLKTYEGDIIGVIGISRDITERKRAEELLQQAKDELEARVEARTAELQQQTRMMDAIFATTPDQFFVLDYEGHLLYASPSSIQPTSNKNPSGGDTNVLSKTWRRISTVQSMSESLNAARDRIFQDCETISGEWEFVRAWGVFHYEYIFSPMRDESGKVISAVCTVHDITERKRGALALERSRAELQTKTESLTVINTIADSIYRSLDVQTIIERALDSVVEYIHVDAAAVLYLDEARKVLEVMSPRGFAPSVLDVGSVLPLEGSLSGVAVKLRDIIVSTDMTYDERVEPAVREQLLRQGMTGAVIVPLLLQERVVGTLNLIFDKPRPLAEHERETLLAIGNTIALAIANARYVEHIKHVVEERERAEYAERRQRILAQTLATTAAVVNSTLDLERVLDAILTSIESVINYDACSIMLIRDSDSHVARGRGYDQYQSTQTAMNIHFPVGDTASIRHMVQSGQSYLVPDTKHDPNWIIVPGMEWVASYLGVPIQVEGDVIGVLNLDSATPHAFTQADARILQAFADQAAIALRNARLYQASHRRQQYLATLRRVSRRSVPERSPKRFMQAVVQALVDEFGYAGAIIMLGDAEKREMRVGASAYDPSIDLHVNYSTYRQSYDSGIYGWVIRNEYPRLVRDTTLEPDFLLVDVDYKSVVAVPVRQYGKTIGVLAVSSMTKNAFDEVDQEVMVELADELALSLENVTLNEKTEQYAADLEQRVKERTAEVESERAQLRVILDSMNEGVIGVILDDPPSQYVNMALLKLLGCDEDTWDPALLWPPEYIHETERVYDTVMEQGIWQGEHRLRRRDGSIFDAAMAVIRIGDAPPNAHGVVTIIRDISQEKELEAKKARFVANASHELRTPITNLITRLYLLRHDANHLQDHIPILEHVAQRMKQLVEDMLEYSRFERGVIPIKPAAVDVRTLLADVVDIQRAEAERKHITLNLDLPDTPLVVQLDPSRMNQVITNLVVNAVNYTPPNGQIHVSMESGFAPDLTPTAIIRVQDTGIGIAEENLESIFVPFFRVRGISSEGSGLGLSIAREIVEMHGGQLTVNSQIGQGSCFTVTLPVIN